MKKKHKKRTFHFDSSLTKHRPQTWDDKIQLADLTLKDCERLCEDGYEVIVEDGRVVDLKKFK